ncbi:hypothetical protein VN12_26335 [Pirellula sp. SH-Sr6A]|uniref:hypothetical protein n=1 Tax=Pirellula sp. SH-Sr6A TaxID=1632865 RepID=UPI00078C047E|nr:hypothetical protein [Pirellula sp. SH-Sr6A]AMV35638.1 hypothetical protein VN12_26335 [Pirellula sp. SH-Sr6A]
MTSQPIPSSTNGPQELLDYLPEDDGYTIPIFYKPAPRIHREVRFRYRPIEILERAILVEFKERKAEREVEEMFAGVIAGRITEWSLVEKVGDTEVPMPISKAKVLRLKPPLFLRMINTVVWGFDGGDEDPKLTVDQTAEDLDRMARAVAEGRPISDVIVGDLRKN